MSTTPTADSIIMDYRQAVANTLKAIKDCPPGNAENAGHMISNLSGLLSCASMLDDVLQVMSEAKPSA